MADFYVRALNPNEVETAADLLARTVSQGDKQAYHAAFEKYRHVLPSRPHAISQHYRGAFRGNQLVSCLLIQGFRLNYGRASLEIAGVGAVATETTFRGRGYASALIRDSLTYAAEQGAAIALLNAKIPRFYERFGFSPVWAHYSFQVPTALAAKLAQVHKLRPAEIHDLPSMEKLYQQAWAGRVSFERSHAAWRWHLAYQHGEALVVEDKQGMIQGYLWQPKEDFNGQVEVAAMSPEAISSLLSHEGKRWQAAGYEMLIWSLPPDDVLIPHAQQMLPVSLTASYFPSEGWMARLIDGAGLLEKLLPEIHAQAKSQWREFEPNQLVLRLTPNGVDIAYKGEFPSQCHLSLRDFIQILFGSLRPETLSVRQPLHPQSIQLLELLFPPRVAAIAAWDWF